MALKHTTVATGTNDGAKQVSRDVWNQDHAFDSDGAVLPFAASTPASPATGFGRAFFKKIAERFLLATQGPSGADFTIQPHLSRNKIARWNPPGVVTTVPGVDGVGALTVVGTATARTPAATNILTRMNRLGFVSAATAAALTSLRVPNAMWTTGNGSGLGGFFFHCRFATSDAAAVSGARAFIGVSSNTGAATNVEPNTLTNSIGVAQLSTNNTQWYLVFGGSAAQTAIALGTGLGAPTLTTTCFELTLYAPASANGTVHYTVTNLGTGVSVSGTLTPATAGVQTPLNSTFLTWQLWRTNNATALAVGLDVASIYMETDQ